MAADIDHARIVEALANSHERRMLGVLQQLEERVAAYAITAPTQDGRLFDLAWSVQARNDIQGIMRETYLTEADSIVREYDQVVESIGTMFEEYESFVGVSPEVVSNLQRVSFQGFQDVAATFSNELADELYQNSLVGRPVAESVKNLRQKINGVYIQSDQAEIQRLVNIANAGGEGAEEAVRELHQTYAADRTGNNMRRYARQMVHDSIMQFDAGINTAAGKEVGATLWKYYGSVVQDSRPHCVKYAGKLFTEDEIREIWTETNWAGKADGDPFIVRGGYNCRHHWRPVFDIEDDQDRADTNPVPETVKLDLSKVTAQKTSRYGPVDDDVNRWVKLVESEGGIRNESTFLMNRYQPNRVLAKKGGGVYYQDSRHIENDPDNKHVFLHEYGHSIDYDLGSDGRPISETRLSEAAKKDAKLLGIAPYQQTKASDPNSDAYIPWGDYEKTQDANILKIRDEISEKINVYYKRGRNKGLLKGYRYEMTDETNRSISDIVDSMTGGYAFTKHHMSGHGVRYYSRGEDWKQTENFANLFANYSKGGEHWQRTTAKFPNLTKAFEELIEDAVNGRIN